MQAWIRKVFGFGLASFFADFSHEMTIALIPTLVGQFVAAPLIPLYLGIVSSVSELFASLMRIISGFLTDHLPRKKPLIMLGYAVATIATTLIGFAQSVWSLLLYRMGAFTGSGLREPPRDALIAATVEPALYGRAFGLRNAMDTLGSLVGPAVALACMHFTSIRGVFVLSLIPGILAVAAIALFTDDLLVHKQIMANRSLRTFWHDLLSLPRQFILFLLILLVFDLGCLNKLLLIARTQEMMHASAAQTASLVVVLYGLFNITRAGSELLIGLASDYVNRMLLLAIFGCGIFAIVALLLMNSHVSVGYCVLCFILSGISAAAVLTLKKACAADMLPASVRGLGYGVLQAIEGVAALISNTLIGFLWAHYSPTLGFSYAAATSLMAMVLLLGFAGLQHRAHAR